MRTPDEPLYASKSMVGQLTEEEPWHQYVESAGTKADVTAPAVVKLASDPS